MSFPRIALLSVGLGRVQRGFERFCEDIFTVLGDELDVTLFVSGGAQNARRRVPPLLRAATAAARLLPLGRYGGRTEYHRDCLAFGCCVWPLLQGNRFDVIHCIDPPLAVVLSAFKNLGMLSVPVLFTEGSVMPPGLYPRVNHIHHVAQAAYDTAVAYGVATLSMSLIPCGVHTRRFEPGETRASLRARYGVPEERFIILVVSALKRAHKRLDYVIEEVSRVEGDVLLWLDGNPEDPTVESLAYSRMGSRCRISHVSSDKVAELYRISNVLVHAALEESFGLSLVEALCSGLSVIAHDSPHFRWLIQDHNSLIDMKESGALTRRLNRLVAARAAAPDTACVEHVRKRFDWNYLRAEYVDLYKRVAAGRRP